MKIIARAAAVFFFAAFFAAVLPAAAGGIEAAQFDSPKQERRYKKIIKELRCLVCQNQTLAESDAPLAADMRAAAARMVRENAAEEDIARFMTTRYGDFVLYRPPFKPETAALWVLPFALALFLLLLLPGFFRRRRAALGEEELRRAAAILAGEKNLAAEEKSGRGE